jgi:hypothetical protein
VDEPLLEMAYEEHPSAKLQQALSRHLGKHVCLLPSTAITICLSLAKGFENFFPCEYRPSAQLLLDPQ